TSAVRGANRKFRAFAESSSVGMTSLPRSRSGGCYGRRNRDMTKRLVQRRTASLAAAGTVALLAVVAVPVAAGGNGNGNGKGNSNTNSNNRLLAAGTATEPLWRGRPWAHPVPK